MKIPQASKEEEEWRLVGQLEQFLHFTANQKEE